MNNEKVGGGRCEFVSTVDVHISIPKPFISANLLEHKTSTYSEGLVSDGNPQVRVLRPAYGGGRDRTDTGEAAVDPWSGWMCSSLEVCLQQF